MLASVAKATRLQAAIRAWLVRKRLRSNFQELCFHCGSHFQSCKIPFQQQRKTMLELARKYHRPDLNTTHCKMPFESQKMKNGCRNSNSFQAKYNVQFFVCNTPCLLRPKGDKAASWRAWVVGAAAIALIQLPGAVFPLLVPFPVMQNSF